MFQSIRLLKIAINCAILLAMATILLGAYTRLTDAGLGCPDWPGCYGVMVAPKNTAQLAQAQEKFPDAKIEPHKAHNEMLHRYIAGFLGIAIVFIFLFCQWQKRNQVLSVFILLLVFMQALLGMLTVTLSLLPVVVLGHLLGGFSLLCLLVLLRIHVQPRFIVASEPVVPRFTFLLWLALVVLVTQISLGAWTSSNYAALACHQLPLCEPGWQQYFSLDAAFSSPLGHDTYQYGVLAHDARLTIHVMHRIGALVALIVVGTVALFTFRLANSNLIRKLALVVAGLLVLQCCLGLINVVAYVPLINAVAHNFVAANLLVTLVVLLDQVYIRKAFSSPVGVHVDVASLR